MIKSLLQEHKYVFIIFLIFLIIFFQVYQIKYSKQWNQVQQAILNNEKVVEQFGVINKIIYKSYLYTREYEMLKYYIEGYCEKGFVYVYFTQNSTGENLNIKKIEISLFSKSKLIVVE